MPQRPDCALCSDIGTIARDPDGGGWVYCVCRKGLEAHINHLAYVLQEYAEALATHEARVAARLVTLTPEMVGDIKFALQLAEYEHDQLEGRWTEGLLDDIELAEPEMCFFSDYVT